MKERLLEKLKLKKSLIALGSVLALAGALFLASRLRQEPKPEPGTGGNASPLYDPHDRPTTIFIKAVSMENGRLFNMKAVIRLSKSRTNQMKQAVLAYLQGPRTGKDQVPVPEGLALGEFYFTPQGAAVVDLSTAQMDASRVGFYEEALLIRGLIETLTSNFYEVKQVKVLVDGQDAPTLAGHYALGTSDVAAPVTANGPID